LNDKNALKRWPTREQILRAVSYVDSPKIKEIIERRLMRYGEVVEPDLLIVQKINDELEYMTDSEREEK
jgi:hypothetical protein